MDGEMMVFRWLKHGESMEMDIEVDIDIEIKKLYIYISGVDMVLNTVKEVGVWRGLSACCMLVMCFFLCGEFGYSARCTLPKNRAECTVG
jgi:hypothetical protein